VNLWAGQTVICVASGPSLTEEDCNVAHESGHRIIAVNSSWRMVESDVIYASDYAWWQRYLPDLTSKAERWTNNRKAETEFGCKRFPLANGCNSGLAAIHLAMWFGAARILLLGYDCKATNGQAHWHGPHTRCNNPNEISFKMWQKQFRQTSRSVRERVVNCSRQTAIACFSRMSLETALAPKHGYALAP
jgi:hypothetical protein